MISDEQMIARWRRDIRSVEATRIIGDWIGDAVRVLNVGPSWGRDYYALSERGKQVINLDIAPQYHLPDTIVADASQSFPFPPCSFDAVLLPEVLEHLIEDWNALRETRRVLKDDGRLLVTVPLYHDVPEYHVRVHSPKSIVRLLAASGFAVVRMQARGGMVQLPRVVHAVRKLLAPLGMDARWYDRVVSFDRWWGTKAPAYRFAQGIYLLARKDEAADWRGLNRETYEHK